MNRLPFLLAVAAVALEIAIAVADGSYFKDDIAPQASGSAEHDNPSYWE